MKSRSLQKLVSQIFSDEKTRSQFVSNPESVLSHFQLTEGEKAAVLETHFNLGLVSANSGQLEAAVAPYSWWASPTP